MTSCRRPAIRAAAFLLVAVAAIVGCERLVGRLRPGDACTTAGGLYCDPDNADQANTCDGATVKIAFGCAKCDHVSTASGADATQVVCGDDKANVAVAGSPCILLGAGACTADRKATLVCQTLMNAKQWVRSPCSINFTCKKVSGFNSCAP